MEKSIQSLRFLWYQICDKAIVKINSISAEYPVSFDFLQFRLLLWTYKNHRLISEFIFLPLYNIGYSYYSDISITILYAITSHIVCIVDTTNLLNLGTNILIIVFSVQYSLKLIKGMCKIKEMLIWKIKTDLFPVGFSFRWLRVLFHYPLKVSEFCRLKRRCWIRFYCSGWLTNRAFFFPSFISYR